MTADAPTPSRHTYVLLDRTGSMQNNWVEALNAVNAYAQTLAAEGGEGDRLTLAAFDAVNGAIDFALLRRDVAAKDWQPLTDAEASPRGMTPLFDAIGRMVALAFEDKPERAVIVIMTDGEENSSREVTRDGAKAALDRAAKQGWETVFLGATFAQFGDAEAVGVTAAKSMGMASGSYVASMSSLARKSRAYFTQPLGEAAVEFDAADRAEAQEGALKTPPKKA